MGSCLGFPCFCHCCIVLLGIFFVGLLLLIYLLCYVSHSVG
uniref:Uncharacterized protein n=1 Tax=Rhizophora mucronata TaxID=61149 RepID=A0A2P2NZX3_RHIMU